MIFMGAQAMTREQMVTFMDGQSLFMHSLIPSNSSYAVSVQDDILKPKCHNLQDTLYSRLVHTFWYVSFDLQTSLA